MLRAVRAATENPGFLFFFLIAKLLSLRLEPAVEAVKKLFFFLWFKFDCWFQGFAGSILNTRQARSLIGLSEPSDRTAVAEPRGFATY